MTPSLLVQKLKSADHHWWPKSLSKFWAAEDGCVTQLSSNGREVRLQPYKFGFIRNAHHIKRGEDSPWNTSFEHIFHEADTNFPALVEWIGALDIKPGSITTPLQKRFLAQPMDRAQRTRLAAALSSLIVRSPRSRHTIRITIESYFTPETPHPGVDKTLVAANMAMSHQTATRAIDGGGKFVILFARDHELIFGDGFLHNFSFGTDRPIAPRCLVPLLPNAAVLFVQSTFYRTEPQLMTIALETNEVEFINRTAQIYSKDHLFFRKQRPTLAEEFLCSEYLEFVYHQHPWLDSVIAGAKEFVPEK